MLTQHVGLLDRLELESAVLLHVEVLGLGGSVEPQGRVPSAADLEDACVVGAEEQQHRVAGAAVDVPANGG